MSTRARQHTAEVLSREEVSAHLVRLRLGGNGLGDLDSTGVPDEWVGVVVPGQFQSRYYTVRSLESGVLELDVVLHDVGLVTEWAGRPDCVGEQVGVIDARGSFAPPPEATWLMLVGDLTALPAMDRIARTTDLPTRVWAEVPDDLDDYLPDGGRGRLVDAPGSRPLRAGRGRRRPGLAVGAGVLLDGGGVLADAGDPQAPDARAGRCRARRTT